MRHHDPEGPRFGVGFADGRRATTTWAPDPTLSDRPDILLMHRNSSGSERRWVGRMGLWPLPPPGEMTVAFLWPALDIDETTVRIDTAPSLEAATRATELWPDERPERPDPGDRPDPAAPG